VEVYLTNGPNSSGIQHSKTLRVDDQFFICGSTNWTSSSRGNHEVSMLLELTAEGQRAVQTCTGYFKLTAEMLTTAKVQQATDLRAGRAERRAKSVEPDRYATAKRFSVARARRLEQERVED